MIRIFLVACFLLSIISGISGQDCEYSNTRAKNGEKLTYQLYYQWGFVWIPAGEVTFELQEKEEHYFVEVLGKTYESYNSFFEVDDYFSSMIDKNTGRPIQFIRDILEGSYTKYDSIHFDHVKKIASGRMGKNRDQANSYSLPIGDCVHDLISVLYEVRNKPLNNLNVGYKEQFTVFFDNESFPLQLEYLGVKSKKIKNLGNRDCHVLSPEVVAGEVFDEESKMKIWVSNDQLQIPLLIESPVIVGTVKAILKEDACYFPK